MALFVVMPSPLVSDEELILAMYRFLPQRTIHFRFFCNALLIDRGTDFDRPMEWREYEILLLIGGTKDY